MMKFYNLTDMAKIDAGDCKGCCQCCVGMGESIIIDPLDFYHLSKSLHKSFEELYPSYIGLHVEDQIILPHVLMKAPEERCVFLSKEGRCTIHDDRPSLCRAFPMGRQYDHGKLQYFILEDACKKENKTKVKVEKWVSNKDVKNNEAFLIKWHYFVKEQKEKVREITDDNELKQKVMKLLNTFYICPYDMKQDFMEQFEHRLSGYE